MMMMTARLHAAIRGREEATALQLIHNAPGLGVDLEGRNATGRTPLMEAALCGLVTVMKSLVGHGVSVDATDPQGSTALGMAVWARQEPAAVYLVEVARAALRVGPALQAVLPNGGQPGWLVLPGGQSAAGERLQLLLLASQQRLPGVITAVAGQLLATRGEATATATAGAADVDIDVDGLLAVVAAVAIEAGRVDVAELLAARGRAVAGMLVKVTYGYGVVEQGLLHRAAACGQTLCAARLVALGCDLQRPDSKGLQPHHLAAYHGHLPMLAWLTRDAAVGHDATRAAKTLALAASAGHLHVVEWLVGHGADPRQRDAALMLRASELAARGGFAPVAAYLRGEEAAADAWEQRGGAGEKGERGKAGTKTAKRPSGGGGGDGGDVQQKKQKKQQRVAAGAAAAGAAAAVGMAAGPEAETQGEKEERAAAIAAATAAAAAAWDAVGKVQAEAAEHRKAAEEWRAAAGALTLRLQATEAEADDLAAARAQAAAQDEQLGALRARVCQLEAELAAALAAAAEQRKEPEPEKAEGDSGSIFDDEFVERLVSEHAQLQAQVNESNGALLAAAKAPEYDDEAEAGCLAGVLRPKGLGFLFFDEVQAAVQEGGRLGKDGVLALFYAMGDMVVDARFDVFERAQGRIVGERRAAVRAKLVAAVPPGKKQPRPAALEALTDLFLRKRREIEAHNPSGGFACHKLWDEAADREQTLPEAVRAVVAAHGQLRAQLQAAKAENAALRRQVGVSGGGGSTVAGVGAGATGGRVRRRFVSPIPAS